VWRCYAKSTLSRDTYRYEKGDTYCTRHQQILEILEMCLQSTPETTGASTLSAGAKGTGACKDTEPECAVWAKYDECNQNPQYMHTACPESCRTCQAAAAQRSPPSSPPRPAAPLKPSPKPPNKTPSPPSKPQTIAPSVPVCQSACDAGHGPTCSGSGTCAAWNGYDWCQCSAAVSGRYVGLHCERPISVGASCPAACGGRGRCLNGWCECDPGWHGVDCTQRGRAQPFLDASALLAAGLRPPSADDPASDTCAAPSIHQAFARPDDDMSELFAVVPDRAPPLKCSSCAVVSNAAVLLEREYGEHIDSNDCVWRLNRAPTQGFERYVGRRTTMDYVNSFPHLHNIRVLPRQDTMLVHGMTIELQDASSGFEKYMGWINGYVGVRKKYPTVEAYILDLAWMTSSWEAYWAHLAPWLGPAALRARPSSGWHVARLALESCDKVRMYGFSMHSTKFHYFDSGVQETINPRDRDPAAGITHRFAWEHEVYANWTREMPDRFELWQ